MGDSIVLVKECEARKVSGNALALFLCAVEDFLHFEAGHFFDAVEELHKSDEHDGHAGGGDHDKAPFHHASYFGIKGIGS